MLSILPLIFLALWARRAAGCPREPGLGFDLRDALIIGAVATGAWAVLGAELLSLFHRFDRGFVIGWWVAGTAALAILNRPRAPQASVLDFRPDTDRFNLLLIGLAAVIILFTGVLAFGTPPSTPDVLCYHLPRQVHWIQNHTVAHYPAFDLRQLEMPPMAELLGAQLMLLSGNDYQANLTQWFSYLLTGLAASAIARDLGAGPRGQSFAALLALLNPAAASQSVNAKNDLVVGLWLLALIWAAVRVWNSRECGPRRAAFMGAALGLLLLTKGTGLIVGPAVCLVIAVGAFRACARRAPVLGAVIILIAAALNAPHWLRNYQSFGSPIALPASKGGFALGNDVHTPAVVASNVLRTLTLHTNSPFPSFNAWQERAVESAHRWMGIDPIDRRTTPGYVTQFEVNPLWANDGNNPAPVHLLLGVGMVLAFRPRRFVGRRAWPVFLLPYVSVFLFAYLLKWQPHNVRLQIPIVASAAPVLGVWMARRPLIILVSVLAAAFLAVSALLWNNSKPLLGPLSIFGKSRDEIMYQIQARNNELLQAREAVASIAVLHPRTIGLDIQAHTNEYSIMRMLLDQIRPPPRLYEHRHHHGPRSAAPPPELVIGSWSRVSAATLYHARSGTRYRCISVFEPFKVYAIAERTGQWKLTTPIPEFFGWDAEIGFGPAEGPYPQFDLPVVRWAQTRVLRLDFESEGGPSVLLMECRRSDRPEQAMSITLNGARVFQFEFGDAWGFLPFTVPLQPAKGPNVLTFEFANLNEPAPQSVLFRKLQIVPADWIESAPPEKLPP